MQKNNRTVRIQLARADIPKFLSMLQETQFNLIEAAVESREKQGFPEASIVIKHIMEKKQWMMKCWNSCQWMWILKY